jgi:hypothetical protein
MGMVYRFSKRNWKSFVLAGALRDGDVDPGDYASPVGVLSHEISDWRGSEFKDELASLEKQP